MWGVGVNAYAVGVHKYLGCKHSCCWSRGYTLMLGEQESVFKH